MVYNAGLKMSINKNQPLLDNNHIIRYVPWSKLRKNENDEVIGILGEAFKPRPSDNEGLSATWIEYYGNDHEAGVSEAIRTLRNGKLAVKPKSGFAVGNVGKIKSACRNYKNIEVNVIYRPSSHNEAHVEVRRLPQDDTELHEFLAEDAWSDLILNSAVSLASKP